MYKIPVKFKRLITNELTKFSTVVNNLHLRGKSSSEDDARIILNDMLSDVLGYDKYNELRTEMRKGNGRYDYVVKLQDGPNSKKKDRFDFVVEAKAAHVTLSQAHINQTLTYCAMSGIDYFILTNAVNWQLYKVKHSKKSPEAKLIHEVNFLTNKNIDSLTEEFYLFSKHAYLSGDWDHVASVAGATKVEDVVAVLLSDKVVSYITKEVAKASNGIKISEELIMDILENQIVKSEVSDINKKLLKKINKKPIKSEKNTSLTLESDTLETIESDEITEELSEQQKAS